MCEQDREELCRVHFGETMLTVDLHNTKLFFLLYDYCVPRTVVDLIIKYLNCGNYI